MPKAKPKPKTPARRARKPDLSHIAEGLRPLAVPVESLRADPLNARTHPEANVVGIRASLEAFGQRKPLVVNRRTGHVEAGNGTLEAALLLGWTHVAAVYVDDDPATAAGFSVADNRTGELSGWDAKALDAVLSQFAAGTFTDLDAMFAELSQSHPVPIAPTQLPGYDEPIPPEHECPSCHYRWIGQGVAS